VPRQCGQLHFDYGQSSCFVRMVASVLHSPLRSSAERIEAFGDATSSPGPLLCSTCVLSPNLQLLMSILIQRTAPITEHIMGATTHTLPPRTPGALEVALVTKLPAYLSIPTSFTPPDNTSSGGYREAAHPREDEQKPLVGLH